MTVPLDPAGDPDRYDATRDPDRYDATRDPDRYDATPDQAPAGPVDWALDPDRYDPAADQPAPLPLGRTGGPRSTLPDLLGEQGSFQDSPSPYIWILGLIGTAAFLLLVAVIFSHLSP